MTHDDIKARTHAAIEQARRLTLPNVTIPEHPAVSLVEDGALVEALVWVAAAPQPCNPAPTDVPRCKTCPHSGFYETLGGETMRLCNHPHHVLRWGLPAGGSGYCHLHPDAEGR